MANIASVIFSDKPISKTFKHKIPEDKSHRLDIYTQPPTIPTKFQTIHYSDSESKAFNSTSQRFEQRINDLPGAGHYANAAEKLEGMLVDASKSKRGYGVGFTSHSRRFVKPPTNLETTLSTSPALYYPRTPVYSFSVAHSLSSSFHSPIIGDVPSANRSDGISSHFVRTRWASKPTPGPGDYTPLIKGRSARTFQQYGNGAESVFNSQTVRSKLGAGGSIPGKDAPAPGAYNIMLADGTTQRSNAGAKAAFKATPRYSHISSNLHVPGPGAYDIAQRESNTRLVVKRGNVGRISVLPLRSTTPLSSQIAIPGSGMTPAAFPGPGHYNIAQCDDALHRTPPILRSDFISRAPRFFDHQLKGPPGPGFYHPIGDIKFRSFHLNMDKQWS
ncbi:hypothetical protein BASA50_008617 [Batrachochytrium salamandrivorans]|uniref:O(6)-methylguanine-induced apoptosis 2 n=1 Tax=Batrachochytrium salamandrivorans TaxID=1357716 RepID=A0ABQ8F3S8_9FUNG|nr:hypothetical protein BASA62_006530 [Batrachochytrium salamandrivorans]KAH6576529.1 hypothetical protein BASA60_004477 [Batrachochytrium salamandrivorans]KAH6591644.1 hypothetical protein BASA50_008617 [Batrachochytrium salamandrivorans]KAH9244931.1 hypothetical protein BASA81_017634 [Batrachochytrium salamandrivorans]